MDAKTLIENMVENSGELEAVEDIITALAERCRRNAMDWHQEADMVKIANGSDDYDDHLMLSDLSARAGRAAYVLEKLLNEMK